ncbi:alpha/beta fold hydrolase [Psychrobacter sp. I-STPA10]|uniref:alpha/beta fold hydrolase n=1 Tax=Psychrobacter sp. I-STPA10 TaxID=2585769 RepID=UPI001E2FB3D3|nr:alpha/beta hydrolase [Psychrobacter sp. I-STPA10]
MSTDNDSTQTTSWDNTSNHSNLPSGWDKLAKFDWQPSALCPQMYSCFIDIDDELSLCVEAGGHPKNPAIILIMGLGSQLVFWPNEFIERLIAAGFFVVRFDNRDMGLSTKIDLGHHENLSVMKMMLRLQVGLSNQDAKVAYHLTHLADDTAKLIKRLDLDEVNLVGASMGGMVAQITAAGYPHLVQKLGLLFTTNNRPFLPTPKPRQLYTLFKKPDSPKREDVVRHGQWFSDVVGSPGHIDQQRNIEAAQLRYQRNYRPKGTVQQLHAILGTGSIASYSQKITAPTLVLHGSKDGLLPPAHGRQVAADIPNARFELIDGMGHDLPLYYLPFIVQRLQRHFMSY